MQAKRYTLPEGCRDRDGNPITEVVIRELTVADELTIATWFEMRGGHKLGGFLAQSTLNQQEAVRCALVEVDGQRVNEDGVPYAGLDRWTRGTYQAVVELWRDVNGIPDTGKAIETAVIVPSGRP